MFRRVVLSALLSGIAIGILALVEARSQAAQTPSCQDHVTWVADVLKRMQTVKPGMTRGDLLKVFTTEGGLSTGLQRTYVSRDCPMFKLDVQFEAVGRPGHDADGRVTLIEGPDDIILSISTPYLQFRVMN